MPTLRQKRAFDKVVENGGIVSRAMIESGYSPETAKSPHKLTRSKGWQQLIKRKLNNKLLMKTHLEGLNATRKEPRIVDRDKKGNPVYDYLDVDDFSIRHKYLDTAYKIRNLYPKDAPQVGVMIAFLPSEAMARYNVRSPSEPSDNNE